MNCKNKSFMTKKKAFTLIELLIVIAIIGILFVVLVSKVDFATDKAKASGVQTDFRSFQMAFDTVAKENAGFNTFGWDTGDANQNGKRDSYDEGDNGAGGGIAQNGIQDGTEVFTGHKVYAETFTKVFSLRKNGTGNYDRDALNRLETAINANLDPKLHITIADDGKITMANGAQDPWNKEYHGWYITNAEVDKKDRGAIVMYSDGANNEFGSEHAILDGKVTITVPNSNKDGKDDYAIVSCYTYVNGYGEVLNMSTGFSNNQSFLAGNVSMQPEEDVDTTEPGLYDSDGDFVSWEQLVSDNDITIYENALIYVQRDVVGTLVIPDGIVRVGDHAAMGCTGLVGVVFSNTITSIEYESFYGCTGLTEVIIPNSVTTLGDEAFAGCTNLTKFTLGNGASISNMLEFCNGIENIVVPDGVQTLGSWSFSRMSGLVSVTLPKSINTIGMGTFYDSSNLTTIYYQGTEADWNNIYIDSDTNDWVNTVNIVFNAQ